MANIYPDKTINYRVYREGSNLIGIGTVELPEIAFMTDTLSGAGLAGEIETPVQGHLQAMSCTINWRTVNEEALALLQTRGATLTLRAAQQEVDTGTDAVTPTGLKIVMKTLPKTTSLGSMEPGASSGTSTELEVTYLKIEAKDKEILEVDKLNFICKVGDQDMFSDVRAMLGMA